MAFRLAALVLPALAALDNDLDWTDAKMLGIRGRANFTESGPFGSSYDRFPSEAQGVVRDQVWGLSRNSAGMYVEFSTCSSKLSVNVTYTSSGMTMWHFPSTGVAGLDLYAWDAATSAWRWTSTTRNIAYPVSTNGMAALPDELRQDGIGRYRLHLPLYNGVEELAIGHSTDCPLLPETRTYPQIVWYGTSIAQGGVASRPGMAFTNWIGRNVEHEILNFGFSGNCLMELSVAKYLAQIPNPAMFVIDCNWNMQADLIQSNIIPLVRYFRRYHPTVPIVLAEDTIGGSDWIVQSANETRQAKREALRAGYEEMIKETVSSSTYMATWHATGCQNDQPDSFWTWYRTQNREAVLADMYSWCIATDAIHREKCCGSDVSCTPVCTLQSAWSEPGFGDENLFYVARESLYNFSDPLDALLNPTVGGTHPTDLGMKKITDFYSEYLPPLLARPPGRVGSRAALPIVAATMDEEERLKEEEAFGSGAEETDIPAVLGSGTTWVWTDVADIGVMGRAFNDTPSIYSRLPSRAQGVVRDEVWNLGLASTGLFVAFTTDATSIALRYSLTSAASALWHMPASGTSGADLFRFDEVTGTWGFVNCVSSFPGAGETKDFTLSAGLPKGPARYLLFLPLRKTVALAAIGVEQGASLPTRDSVFAADGVTMNGLKPIVWYGTSIDQGGVASRPGATYTNSLTRNLGRVVLNLGFAGNGMMELEVAQFLTEIDAAAIVVDCLPNMQPADVSNRTGPLVRYIRERHPNTPIVLAAGTWYGKHWFAPQANDNKLAALREEYTKLLGAGVGGLWLVDNAVDELFGSNPMVNPTVGGTHPTDLGHWEIASFYTKYFQQLLPSKSLTAASLFV